MAKTRASAKTKAETKTEGERSGRSDRRTIIVLKGTAAYEEWLNEAARKMRMPASVIVDVAVAAWAAANGLPEPPTRLGGRG